MWIFLLNFSGIEALGKVRGAVAGMGKSFLKRLKELKDGVPIGKVAANMLVQDEKKYTGNQNWIS